MEGLNYALDQRRLWVTPRVANVDDEGNPAIVDDSLSVTLTLPASLTPAQRRETYASELDGLDDPFLHTQQSAQTRRGAGARSLTFVSSEGILGVRGTEERACRETPTTFLAGQAPRWLIVELVLACDLHSQNVSRRRIVCGLHPKFRAGICVDARVCDLSDGPQYFMANCRVGGHPPR